MGYITAIGTAAAPHQIKQSSIADFMVKAMKLDYAKERLLRTIFKSSGIDYRHSVLADYGRTSGFTFFSEDENGPFPSTQKRIDCFRQHALPLSVEAAQIALKKASHIRPEDITHLIVVCCTGMYAPGLDIDLVNSVRLRSTVHRTAITFMGCYAAFNALKAAQAFCLASKNSKVLIVCTELCSLHFQNESTEDNLLANALFADGSAAVIMESTTPCGRALETVDFFNDLYTEGAQDMAWTIGDHGFEMKLSSYVPGIIKKGIKTLAASLVQRTSLSLDAIQYFAIHPGGKKILEVIESELGLTKVQNEAAYQVLRRYGNMSSPTVLFVLDEIFNKITKADNDGHVMSFAFGPGLTLESMVLKIFCNE